MTAPGQASGRGTTIRTSSGSGPDTWTYVSYGLPISLPISYGVTGGIMFGARGWYPYLGSGPMTPGPSVSITGSPGTPFPGWNFAFQLNFGGAVQVGIDQEYGGFWEVGAGLPAGFAYTGFVVSQPLPYPMLTPGSPGCLK